MDHAEKLAWIFWCGFFGTAFLCWIISEKDSQP